MLARIVEWLFPKPQNHDQDEPTAEEAAPVRQPTPPAGSATLIRPDGVPANKRKLVPPS